MLLNSRKGKNLIMLNFKYSFTIIILTFFWISAKCVFCCRSTVCNCDLKTLCTSTYIIKDYFAFQLGVSNVAELRQALGTSVEVTPKKVGKKEEPQQETPQEKSVKEDASTDELVYKDSSTFLKV